MSSQRFPKNRKYWRLNLNIKIFKQMKTDDGDDNDDDNDARDID